MSGALNRTTLVAYFEAVWDTVLVPLCGASKEPFERLSFVISHTEDEYPCNQYRFCGSFGFGGKLIRASDLRTSIAYYPEDTTPARDEKQRVANLALQELWLCHIGQPT